MDEQPVLSRIWIFPIKSLEGVSVNAAKITRGGALELDREFALVDEAGKFVNAKRTTKIHQVRSQFNLAQQTVTLSSPDQDPQTFHWHRDRDAMAAWFSVFFEFRIQLVQDVDLGFPDDRQASGPTMISEATLETTARWFEGMTVNDMRSRLRTNLEISGVPAFWEDRLFSEDMVNQGFHLDSVKIYGRNPCQRCVVPTRDQFTGQVWPKFQKTVAVNRQASLPDWSSPDMFNHYYRLAVNTKISDAEYQKILTVGAKLTLP